MCVSNEIVRICLLVFNIHCEASQNRAYVVIDIILFYDTLWIKYYYIFFILVCWSNVLCKSFPFNNIFTTLLSAFLHISFEKQNIRYIVMVIFTYIVHLSHKELWEMKLLFLYFGSVMFGYSIVCTYTK